MPPYPLTKRLRRLSASALHTVRHTALQAGLGEGHTDYVRYLMLGRARTGSNMLRTSLARNPGVVAYGEIFRTPGLIGWDAWPYSKPASGHGQFRHMLALMQRDPVRFLERHVYGRHPLRRRAVGFKMFYYYAHQPHWEPVWTYLAEHTDIRVIHLKRRNRLRTFISTERALRNERWTNHSGAVLPQPTVRTTPSELQAFFERNERWEADYDHRFAAHPVLQVVYEDLVADYDAEMARIQAFLDVPPAATQPRTHRQSRGPLSAAIEDYDALKRHFADTRWAGFFED